MKKNNIKKIIVSLIILCVVSIIIFWLLSEGFFIKLDKETEIITPQNEMLYPMDIEDDEWEKATCKLITISARKTATDSKFPFLDDNFLKNNHDVNGKEITPEKVEKLAKKYGDTNFIIRFIKINENFPYNLVSFNCDFEVLDENETLYKKTCEFIYNSRFYEEVTENEKNE